MERFWYRVASFKVNDLFRPGPNGDLNACVGENGGPYDFFDYALGYFKGAAAIARAAERRELPVDIAVYPMVYSYRHGIELCLKHLGRIVPPLFGDPPAVLPTHKLMDTWEEVKPYLQKWRGFESASTVPVIDKVIEDVLAFDPNGEVFRFPEDRRGDLHLQDARIINLDVLREAVEQTSEVFSFLVYGTDDYRRRLFEIKVGERLN
jgi:hypothetical protein